MSCSGELLHITIRQDLLGGRSTGNRLDIFCHVCMFNAGMSSPFAKPFIPAIIESRTYAIRVEMCASHGRRSSFDDTDDQVISVQYMNQKYPEFTMLSRSAREI